MLSCWAVFSTSFLWLVYWFLYMVVVYDWGCRPSWGMLASCRCLAYCLFVYGVGVWCFRRGLAVHETLALPVLLRVDTVLQLEVGRFE
jgi:hypothetical protein